MHSDFFISQTDGRPMYLQIMEQIKRRIAVGDWPAGHELPSIRALAAAAQVSVITVKRAYMELEREGVIVTQHGRGSFVADGADLGPRLQRDELEEHLEEAVRLAEGLGMSAEELDRLIRNIREKRTRQAS